MKKLITAIAASAVLALCLAGCACEHVWEDADCTAPKTCSECGETEGEALGHEWEEASCYTPKTCAVCEEEEGEPAGCSFENGVCVGCGITDREEVEYSLSNYRTVLNDCLNDIPNCELYLLTEGSNSYSINNGDDKIVGITGTEIDDFQAVSLVDPDKPNATETNRQMMTAMIMAFDNWITYEEACEMVERLYEDNAFIEMGTFYSFGMADGMYFFGIQ